MRGLGVDLVAVSRFDYWHQKTIKSLRRLFHENEIEYCLKDVNKSAERFAVRFAAKEAFFKALTQYDPLHKAPFLTIATLCSVQRHVSGLPLIQIDWEQVRGFLSQQETILNKVNVSISHEKEYAVVIVWF